MTLTAKDVAEITRLLADSSFDELHLETDNWKLSLRRGAGDGGPAPRAAAPAADAAATPAASAPPSARADAQTVAAPMLGTFYRAPRPGAPPFVEVGSTVEPDSIVGIIEVMKLMTAVNAGVSGIVTEILVRDGALVEFGEILLCVARPD